MDKYNIKAQGGMEFLLLAGILLFIFILIIGIVSHQTTYMGQKRNNMVGEDIVTKVQKEINLAAKVLDGYSRVFYLPKKLGNFGEKEGLSLIAFTTSSTASFP